MSLVDTLRTEAAQLSSRSGQRNAAIDQSVSSVVDHAERIAEAAEWYGDKKAALFKMCEKTLQGLQQAEAQSACVKAALDTFANRVESTFTPKDFENMLWSTHAAVIGNDPSVSNDKYNDNHYAVNPSTGAGDNLVKYMTAHSPFPITASSTWAYDCTQDYLIDPTGWAIQVNDWTMTYPNCGDLAAATKIEAKAKAKMAVVESA